MKEGESGSSTYMIFWLNLFYPWIVLSKMKDKDMLHVNKSESKAWHKPVGTDIIYRKVFGSLQIAIDVNHTLQCLIAHNKIANKILFA